MSTGDRVARGKAGADRVALGETASFVCAHFKFNLASAMEYRWSFISQVALMTVNDFMMLFFWWLIFSRVPDIAGWTFRDVITMQSVVALAFGLNVSVFGNLHRIPQLIARGQLDYYLLLPKDPLLHMLVSRSDISGFGDMAFGIAAFMVFTSVSWQRVILFLATSLAAATVYASFVTVAGSLAFLMGNAQTVGAQLAQAMVTFSGYPGSLFKGAVRALLYSAIPVGFFAYVPVELLRNFSWTLFAGLIAFAACSAIVAKALFRAGLRRYESGNLMAIRA